MANKDSTNVFISYSHDDTSLVSPIVSLLRANQSLVFQDIDRIQPGKKWRNEIRSAIDRSQLVVIFWCNHASQSNEIENEWRTALEQGKDLLPLLLDETPLPTELSEFQWIDFRATVGPQHKKKGRKLNRRFLSSLLVAAPLLAGTLLFTQQASQFVSSPTDEILPELAEMPSSPAVPAHPLPPNSPLLNPSPSLEPSDSPDIGKTSIDSSVPHRAIDNRLLAGLLALPLLILMWLLWQKNKTPHAIDATKRIAKAIEREIRTRNSAQIS